MTDIHIPPEALEAGARFLFKDEYPEANITWDDLNAYEREAYRAEARAAFTAMVEAWPGAQRVKGYFTHDTDYYEPAFILPIPQEKPDGEV